MSLSECIQSARQSDEYQPVIEMIPYAHHLGVQMHRDDEGFIFELPFREGLVGNHLLPALHGGVVAGFMENSAMLHILVHLEQGQLPKTVDFSIDYLRSAGPETTWCRCEVTRQGRRVAHVQISCWQSDRSKPVAVARIHFILDDESVEEEATTDASPL